jgi:hypothetical protein
MQTPLCRASPVACVRSWLLSGFIKPLPIAEIARHRREVSALTDPVGFVN